jgi:hypothetical protein
MEPDQEGKAPEPKEVAEEAIRKAAEVGGGVAGLGPDRAASVFVQTVVKKRPTRSAPPVLK